MAFGSAAPLPAISWALPCATKFPSRGRWTTNKTGWWLGRLRGCVGRRNRTAKSRTPAASRPWVRWRECRPGIGRHQDCKKGLGGPSAGRGHKSRPLAIAYVRSDAIMAISRRAPTKPRENPLPGGGGGPRRPQADHTSIRFGLRAMSPLGRRGDKEPGGGWSRSRRLGRPHIYQGGDHVNLLGDCTKGLHA